MVVQLQTEKKYFIKENSRLETDLQELKEKSAALTRAQTRLLEAQKQTLQLQYDLSQSQRERDSLSQLLTVPNKNTEKQPESNI